MAEALLGCPTKFVKRTSGDAVCSMPTVDVQAIRLAQSNPGRTRKDPRPAQPLATNADLRHVDPQALKTGPPPPPVPPFTSPTPSQPPLPVAHDPRLRFGKKGAALPFHQCGNTVT